MTKHYFAKTILQELYPNSEIDWKKPIWKERFNRQMRHPKSELEEAFEYALRAHASRAEKEKTI